VPNVGDSPEIDPARNLLGGVVMMNHAAIVLSSLLVIFTAACVESALGPELPDPVPTSAETVARFERAFAAERDTCPVVADEGPCAVACDREALLEYIAPGTCLTFGCYDADGDLVNVGACSPD
jgi:hypothetical protein